MYDETHDKFSKLVSTDILLMELVYNLGTEQSTKATHPYSVVHSSHAAI